VTKRARGTNRVMASATRVECDGESNGFSSKSNGNEDGNNQLTMGACEEEGKGSKAMAMGIRLAGNKDGKGDK
jgi:hypothetical protein